MRRTNILEIRLRVTDTQTDKPNYSNPCCACVPRVNKGELVTHGLLALRHDGSPDTGHGQLDAGVGVVLIAVESWDQKG